jgi:hypothetical protein
VTKVLQGEFTDDYGRLSTEKVSSSLKSMNAILTMKIGIVGPSRTKQYDEDNPSSGRLG